MTGHRRETLAASLIFSEENIKAKEKKKKNRSSGQKRRNKKKGKEIEAAELDQFNINDFKSDEVMGEKKSKLLRVKKRKIAKINEFETDEVDELHNAVEDGFDEQIGANAAGEKRKSKLRKKKRKIAKIKEVEITEVDELHNEVEDDFDEQIGANAAGEKREGKLRKKKRKNEKIKKSNIVKVEKLYDEVEDGYDEQSGNSEKACKVAKGHLSSREDEKLMDKRGETDQDEVYQISSGDEDCSRGMKKWTMEYYQSRPGLKILQQRIDDFITAHEEQEEKARKEREERVAEGGWTVVTHHKGRKKTADSESGITVGSVAPAAVLDKMAKKKTKEVGLDFYRFQKREAQRNEIMMLQSKFEQDKKRIQQLRAARKFRPY